jgi:signal peptidase I
MVSSFHSFLGLLWALSPIARYIINGPSMLPTFAAGDRIIVNRLAYRWRSPAKGDIVAVRHPFDEEKRLLKRVTAGPGELVTVGSSEYQLGRDEWYVVGDNQQTSTDSRQFGPVERRQIIGKVWFRY